MRENTFLSELLKGGLLRAADGSAIDTIHLGRNYIFIKGYKGFLLERKQPKSYAYPLAHFNRRHGPTPPLLKNEGRGGKNTFFSNWFHLLLLRHTSKIFIV
jgi:hypothetical protein